MSVFPVKAPRVDYSSRFDGRHQGVDIFAPAGSEVLAVTDGRARSAVEPRGGLVVYVVAADKTQFYYSHLDNIDGEFPRRVKEGELLGFVGNTGNASGGPPHVHFELRPAGGEKVDPTPFLDSWRMVMPPPDLVRVPPVSRGSRSRATSPSWLIPALVLGGLWFLSKNRRGGWI